jgi:hypothetical protein
MRPTFLIGCFLLLGAAFPGCGGHTDGPCPVDTVILDAGIDGLPDIGQCVAAKICEDLCKPWHPVCCRSEELVLKCQYGCK